MAFFAFWFFSFFLIVSGTMVVLSKNSVHGALYLILAFFNGSALFLILGAEFLAMLLVIVYVGAVAVLFLFVVMMLDIKSRRPVSLFSMAKIKTLGTSALRLFSYLIIFLSVFAGAGYGFIQWLYIHSYTKDPQFLMLAAAILFFIGRYAAFTLTKINFFDSARRFFSALPLPFLMGLIISAELLVLSASNHAQPLLNGVQDGISSDPYLANAEALGMLLYSSYLAPFLLSGLLLLVAMIGAIVLTLRPRKDAKKQNISHQHARNKENTLKICKIPLRQGLDFLGEKK